MAPRGCRYEMEDFLGYRRDKNKDFYLVSWAGYSDASNSWEPRTNIMNPSRETRDKMKKIKAEFMSLYSDESPDDGVVCIEREQSQRSCRKRAASPPTPPTSTTRHIQEHDISVVTRSVRADNHGSSNAKSSSCSTAVCINVVHLKQINGSLFVYALMGNLTTSDNKHINIKSHKIPVEEFRLIYPQMLIDYFIKNYQSVITDKHNITTTTKIETINNQDNNNNNKNSMQISSSSSNSNIDNNNNENTYNNNNKNNNIDKQYINNNNSQNKSPANSSCVRSNH
eukprot:GHVS01058319.1.p1 GENE.GHVS01058319.1~~GHVS01058319.1.p1  ORF type:complete len:283 (+),score=60.88 GHVS01058319.1:346-1194(+)